MFLHEGLDGQGEGSREKQNLTRYSKITAINIKSNKIFGITSYKYKI